MALASHQLDAFLAVAETGGFSRAAKRLGVTQPALSQRIQQLESELKRRLFVRGPRGVSVTDAGARLLRYCEVRRALESEVLDDLAVETPGAPGLSGTVRVAAYSSLARSCVLPAMAQLLQDNPQLIVDVMVREMGELKTLLTQGTTELVFLDHIAIRPDVEHVPVGNEYLVLVESRTERARARDEVYLDHDREDTTTLEFLGKSGVRTRYVRRSFFDDVYGVLDAAALGFGRAVVPRHLLVGDVAQRVRIATDVHPIEMPVVLHQPRQPSYTRAHEAVRAALLARMPAILAQGE